VLRVTSTYLPQGSLVMVTYPVFAPPYMFTIAPCSKRTWNFAERKLLRAWKKDMAI